MASLATVADVETILGRELTGDEETRYERLLEMKSRVVRAYTGQFLEEVTETVTLTPDAWGQVRLPQRPVTAVTSVTVDGETVDADGYTWTPSGTLARVYGYWSRPVVVNYTHGYNPIPDDIAMVVAEMAVAGASSSSAPSGVKSESIGSYSVSYSDTQSSSVSAAHASILDRYKANGRPISQYPAKSTYIGSMW